MNFRFSEAAAKRRAQRKADRYITTQKKLQQVEDDNVLTFREFIEKVDPTFGYVVSKDGQMSDHWHPHIERLVDVLHKVAHGEITRLMVWMPPRHYKSVLCSKFLPAYYLYLFPTRWVGMCGYGTELTYDFSRAARRLYQEVGRSLSVSSWSVRNWMTEDNGGMWSTSIGGPATGREMNLGIIDDPIKNAEEATSALVRQRHADWYSSVFYTRRNPIHNAIVVVMTRWNDADLCGYLLDKETASPYKENWHIVAWSAIKEEDPFILPDSCTLEPDPREVGESLAPDWMSADDLRRTEAQIGKWFFRTMYQQRPTERDGTFFKKDWYEIVDAVPALTSGRIIRAWDIASTKDDGDYTVGVKMMRVGDMFFILDVVRGQWDSTTRDRIMRQTAMLDGPTVKIAIEKQPGSAGVDMGRKFINLLAGFSVQNIRPTGDKADRADPFASQLGAGNVKLLKGDWNAEYIDEFLSFPSGKHDDQVDATSLAFNRLSIAQTTATVVR